MEGAGVAEWEAGEVTVGATFGAWRVLGTEGFRTGRHIGILCECRCGVTRVHQVCKLKSIPAPPVCRRCLDVSKRKSWPIRYLGHIQRGARKRAKVCNLTCEDLERQREAQEDRCKYTGLVLTWSESKNGLPQATASLDRIDSALPYQPGNIQWVHKVVNNMKSTYTEEEFLQWCRAVTAHATLDTPTGSLVPPVGSY